MNSLISWRSVRRCYRSSFCLLLTFVPAADHSTNACWSKDLDLILSRWWSREPVVWGFDAWTWGKYWNLETWGWSTASRAEMTLTSFCCYTTVVLNFFFVVVIFGGCISTETTLFVSHDGTVARLSRFTWVVWWSVFERCVIKLSFGDAGNRTEAICLNLLRALFTLLLKNWKRRQILVITCDRLTSIGGVMWQYP